ncbi:AlpA family phage regulatory protein [Photobacterium leiognathi]|uniref:AlpA family phage regulatory protein n=1 Tax=Photobacterium leiognathi TaxID=553611 RepID=UPI002980BBA0|nr:AlpA family phage regulatory protein [Photobacterium leiognathi]
MSSYRFIRLQDVMKMTGLSKASIYRAMNKDEFPHQYQLTEKAVGWKDCDVMKWMDTRKQIVALDCNQCHLLNEVFKK